MNIDIQSVPRFVINLEKRPERLTQFREEEKWLFDTETPVLKGHIARTPMEGCAQSHLEVIRLAKANGWPLVLIMEDDCVFQAKERTRGYVEAAFQNSPDRFDIILGGVYQASETSKLNEYWNQAKRFSATHFYVVKQTAYDKILDKYDHKQHIDVWMSRNVSSFVARKMFAIQRPGYSDNVLKDVDYSHMLKRSGIVLL